MRGEEDPQDGSNPFLGLKLVGFKPISSLKWGHFVRSGSFLYPEDKVRIASPFCKVILNDPFLQMIKGSRNIFAALLIKCTERRVFALCSYKPRDASTLSFVALVPQNEEKDDKGRQVW